jgi:hypothetical protein
LLRSGSVDRGRLVRCLRRYWSVWSASSSERRWQERRWQRGWAGVGSDIEGRRCGRIRFRMDDPPIRTATPALTPRPGPSSRPPGSVSSCSPRSSGSLRHGPGALARALETSPHSAQPPGMVGGARRDGSRAGGCSRDDARRESRSLAAHAVIPPKARRRPGGHRGRRESRCPGMGRFDPRRAPAPGARRRARPTALPGWPA